jgi:hypothetical protein
MTLGASAMLWLGDFVSLPDRPERKSSWPFHRDAVAELERSGCRTDSPPFRSV